MPARELIHSLLSDQLIQLTDVRELPLMIINKSLSLEWPGRRSIRIPTSMKAVFTEAMLQARYRGNHADGATAEHEGSS
jgi:hypothetical protein